MQDYSHAHSLILYLCSSTKVVELTCNSFSSHSSLLHAALGARINSLVCSIAATFSPFTVVCLFLAYRLCLLQPEMNKVEDACKEHKKKLKKKDAKVRAEAHDSCISSWDRCGQQWTS